jgi:hypothetical protein
MVRVARWTLGGVAVLALGILGLMTLLFVLNRTQAGQSFVLSRALQFLEERIDGDLRIEGIRSSGLMDGFTLRGVSLVTQAGRPFFTADSLEVRYALRSFFGGDIVLNRVEVWGPDVLLEPLPGEERLNVLGIFRLEPDTVPPVEEPEVEGEVVPPGRQILIRELEVHDGEVVLRVAAVPDPAGETAGSRFAIPRGTVPGVGEVLELSVRELAGSVEDLRILDPEAPGQRMSINTLSGLVRVFDEPVRVADIRGELLLTADSVLLDAERLWLPDTEMAGRVALALGGDQVDLAVDVEATVVRMSDLRWLLPDLPEGTGRGDFRVRLLDGDTRIEAVGVDFSSGRSRLRGGGMMTLPEGGVIRFAGLDVEALPLGLELVQRFLSDPLPLPLDGEVRGRIRADGPLEALRVVAQATLSGVGRAPTSGQVEGTVHAGERPGGSGLRVVAAPLDYGLVGDLVPGFRLTGSGRMEGTLQGRFGETMQLDVIALHTAPGVPESSVEVRGSVTGQGEGLTLDLEAILRPLSLDALARDWPDLPAAGRSEAGWGHGDRWGVWRWTWRWPRRGARSRHGVSWTPATPAPAIQGPSRCGTSSWRPWSPGSPIPPSSRGGPRWRGRGWIRPPWWPPFGSPWRGHVWPASRWRARP